MDTSTLNKVLRLLKKEISKYKIVTAATVGAKPSTRPFRILVSTILSARTRDHVTEAAAQRLLERAPTAETLGSLTIGEIERLIYPVGFYRTKAKYLKETCRLLLKHHNGKVPGSLEELLKLPGVGRKTANLVLTAGFHRDGICVDTHVHRISNIWRYVSTKTPEETELELRRKLPRRHWKSYNAILVNFGQNICLPLSPWCSKCPVFRYCPRAGVRRWR